MEDQDNKEINCLWAAQPARVRGETEGMGTCRASDAQQWAVWLWLGGMALFTHRPLPLLHLREHRCEGVSNFWGLAFRNTASLAVLPLTPVLIHTSSYLPDPQGSRTPQSPARADAQAARLALHVPAATAQQAPPSYTIPTLSFHCHPSQQRRGHHARPPHSREGK